MQILVLLIVSLVVVLLIVILLSKLAMTAAGALICALPSILILWVVLAALSKMTRGLFE